MIFANCPGQFALHRVVLYHQQQFETLRRRGPISKLASQALLLHSGPKPLLTRRSLRRFRNTKPVSKTWLPEYAITVSCGTAFPHRDTISLGIFPPAPLHCRLSVFLFL